MNLGGGVFKHRHLKYEAVAGPCLSWCGVGVAARLGAASVAFSHPQAAAPGEGGRASGLCPSASEYMVPSGKMPPSHPRFISPASPGPVSSLNHSGG